MSSADKNKIYSKIFLIVVFVACPLFVFLGSAVFGIKELLSGVGDWWKYLFTLALGYFVLRWVYVTLTSKDSRSVYERAVGDYTNWLAQNIHRQGEDDFEIEKQIRLEHLEDVRTGRLSNNVMYHTK